MNDKESAPCVGPTGATLGSCLLDSSLIVTTTTELYNIKLVNCGDYTQVYYINEKKSKKVKKDKEINIKKINTDNLRNNTNTITTNNIETKNIDFKNIMRSKLECQRLAKANASEWSTFITLTIAENITDINRANKKLRYFIDKIKRIYKNLKYICIPEFQKRGAVHYHMLTNIKIDDTRFIYKQEDKENFKHIKYWNEGFTKVDNLEKDIKKIIGYISKYMTKDADNRLFNHHRYFYSRNLEQPKVSYLNLDIPKHLEFYNKIINNKSIIYNNTYKNFYNDDLIEFKEFL